jgi:hypothetical protein
VSVDSGTPITVRATTNALWLAEETVGSLEAASNWALILTIAYYGVVGEPEHAATIDQVRAWAREHKVRVEELPDEGPDPTPARSGGRSSRSR